MPEIVFFKKHSAVQSIPRRVEVASTQNTQCLVEGTKSAVLEREELSSLEDMLIDEQELATRIVARGPTLKNHGR